MKFLYRMCRCVKTVDMYGMHFQCDRPKGHPGVHYSDSGRLSQVQWPDGWQYEGTVTGATR